MSSFAVGASAANPPTDAILRLLEIIERALTEAGAHLSDVVRTRMFLTATDDADRVSAVHGELFGDIRPTATMVVVAALLDPRWKIEIEAEAITPDDRAPTRDAADTARCRSTSPLPRQR